VLVGLNQAGDRVISGEDDLPDGFRHWMVKLAASTDAPDAGPLEYAYGLMAVAAGIEMPELRLLETIQGDRFFAVERFDRDGNRRSHVHSFGDLLQINFRIPSADYADLLKATSLLTRDHEDVLRVFRRMVFNVLAHNRDDHVKNFAFILDDTTGRWSVSPAYDLLYTSGPGGEHTMTVAGEGRDPGRPHLLRVAEGADLAKREALTIIEEVEAAVARWPQHAKRAGLSRTEIHRIARALPRLG
jgi:serine/threonine-protein kinase HipA